jgi:hypothetical protein
MCISTDESERMKQEFFEKQRIKKRCRMLQITKVNDWSFHRISSRRCSWLPKKFIMKYDGKEDLSGGLGLVPAICGQKGPNGDSCSFFWRYGAWVESLHKAPGIVIVHIKEETSSDEWKDAIFSLKKSKNKKWKGELLFHGAGTRGEDDNLPISAHWTFKVVSFENRTLEIEQSWYDCHSRIQKEKKTIVLT